MPARSANEICAARTGRGCTSLLSNMPRSVAVWTGLEIEPEVTEVLVEADEAMLWFNGACVAQVCTTTTHHRQSRPCSSLQSRDRAQRRCPQGSSSPSRGVNVSSNIGWNVYGQWLVGWLAGSMRGGGGWGGAPWLAIESTAHNVNGIWTSSWSCAAGIAPFFCVSA